MHDLIKALSEIKAETWGAVLVTVLIGSVKALGPWLAKLVTDRFKRSRDEINALAERENEVVMAADDFGKDAELLRLHRSVDALERENRLLKSHVTVLEDAKIDLEMELARLRVERATGKHKALPPAIHDVTDQIDTERPRSASRQLPPLPTKPAKTTK